MGLAAIAGLLFFLLRRRKRNAASKLPTQDSPHYASGGSAEMDQGQNHSQGEYRGDFKPYGPVMSEAPGSDVAGTPPVRYEMDARQRHELA